MMKNILIIDDSALMRRVLSDIIGVDDRFKVFDVAINGIDAMSIMESKATEIDAILLDINMPKMNGLEFLEELKKKNIKATIIIVSTIAKNDAKETILALELGAFDFVTKPESYEEVKSNSFSDRIIECLEAATKISSIAKPSPEQSKREIPGTKAKKALVERNKSHRSNASKGSVDGKLVAIACSTGGPKALHTVIPDLPVNLDASVLIVQHMPEGFTKSLADRLNDLSKIPVKEAEDGDILQKGVVYLAAGGRQMRLIKNPMGQYQISVKVEAPRSGLLPCADIMYESLAETDFDQFVCVVLTGMGGDGTRGIKAIDKRKKNIHVIAQDEETCIVYGMPKVIAESGLVNEVVPLQSISEAIIRNVGVQ